MELGAESILPLVSSKVAGNEKFDHLRWGSGTIELENCRFLR